MFTRVIFEIGFLLLIVNVIVAQRPSFAGPRPTGGLNQKDKYHLTSGTTTNTTAQQQNLTFGIGNRFGGNDNNVNTNTIPYGASQRPPMGWPIVAPQAQYVPLNVNQPVAPQFSINDRIGGNDVDSGSNNLGNNPSNNFGSSGGGQIVVPPNFNAVNNSPLPTNSQLPLDAHGDQALIDYLNSVPVESRPFWFLNYQAIEAQRNSTSPTFTGAAVGSRSSFFG